jgi:hypothetical protein
MLADIWQISAIYNLLIYIKKRRVMADKHINLEKLSGRRKRTNNELLPISKTYGKTIYRQAILR